MMGDSYVENREIRFSAGLRKMAEEGRFGVIATIKAAVMDAVRWLQGERDVAAAEGSWLEQWVAAALNLDLVLGADEEGGRFVFVRVTIGDGTPLPVGSPSRFKNGDWRQMLKVASGTADDISGELTRDFVVVGELVKLPCEITQSDMARALSLFTELLWAAKSAGLAAENWANSLFDAVRQHFDKPRSESAADKVAKRMFE